MLVGAMLADAILVDAMLVDAMLADLQGEARRHGGRARALKTRTHSSGASGGKKHYGISEKMRILNASEELESQKTLRGRSKNANFECQPRTGKLKKHYGIAVKMRILNASKELES